MIIAKIILAGAVLALSSGCHANDDRGGLAGHEVAGAATRTLAFDARDFNGVILAGPDHVVIRDGQNFAVTAAGDRASLDALVIRVRDHGLDIHRKRGSADSPAATITVTMPSLVNLTIAGSGGVTADRLTGAEAEATVAGSGDARIARVDARVLKTTVAGPGDLTLAGSVEQADITIAGSGNLAASALAARRASVSVAGSGSVAMAVNGDAAVTVVGSGDVVLTGGAHCTTTSMGSGSVRCS